MVTEYHNDRSPLNRNFLTILNNFKWIAKKSTNEYNILIQKLFFLTKRISQIILLGKHKYKYCILFF